MIDDSKLQASVALIGLYPPPYGGVSVFIQRMIYYLDNDIVDYVVYNTGVSKTNHPKIIDVKWSLLAMIKILLLSEHKIIHFNTSRMWVRLFAAMVKITTGSKIIISAHGYSLPISYFDGGFIRKSIVSWSLSHFERVIATNPELCMQIIEMGMPANRVDVIPAFIPPSESLSTKLVPYVVQNFCVGKSPILTANGSYVLSNGRDVYGLRLLVKLTEDLLPTYPNIGIVVYMREGAEFDKECFYDTLLKTQSPELRNHILFYDSSSEFYHIFSISDVFLRPTITDGDANSIREALYFGVPVIASDVVPRPAGCILYSVDNYLELVEKTKSTIDDLPNAKKRIANVPQFNAAIALIKLYRELLA